MKLEHFLKKKVLYSAFTVFGSKIVVHETYTVSEGKIVMYWAYTVFDGKNFLYEPILFLKKNSGSSSLYSF